MARANGLGFVASAPRRVWLAGCAVIVTLTSMIALAGTAQAASGMPCKISNGACVALGSRGYNGTAWMVRGGKVVRGPISALTGGPGEDTPTGTFHVMSKDLHHVSSATRNAKGQPSPMPYAVFFTSSGVAFHGTQAGENSAVRTAGCIRLPNSDASYFFKNLSVGDTVQVVNGGGDYGSSSSSRGDDDDHDDSGSGHSGGGGGGGLLGGL
jgi:L,D-transpeptidase-like protein